MKFVHLIWSNLKRKKLRTILTLLSVLVAFVLYGYLSAIGHGLSQGVTVEGANRLVVRHRISIIQMLPISYQARMSRIPGVDRVTHATFFGGTYQDSKSFFAQMPVVPDEYLAMFPEYLLPEDQREAWLKTRTGAIAGRKLAERYKWKVGDRIPIQTSIWQRKDGTTTWEFDLVGIYDGKDPNTDTSQLYFRYDYFDEGRVFGEGQVGWYFVRVEDPQQAAAVAAAIDNEFANSPAETKAETEGAFAQAFAQQVGDIGMIVGSILAAVFFTILLVAGNTMAQAVRERTEELGVLKALGFTHGKMLGLVLAESCLLSALGGFAGLAIAWLLISAGDPTGGMLPLFHFPLRDVALGAGLVAALGLLTGLFPAIQAMRLTIAEALRRT